MTSWMDALLARGRVIDLALAVIALEMLVFVLARRKLAARRLGLLDLVGQLLAGAFLLTAFRLVLVGARPAWVLLALTASFPAHLYDVARRLRPRERAPDDSRPPPSPRVGSTRAAGVDGEPRTRRV